MTRTTPTQPWTGGAAGRRRRARSPESIEKAQATRLVNLERFCVVRGLLDDLRRGGESHCFVARAVMLAIDEMRATPEAR